jgi:hypothetical protein
MAFLDHDEIAGRLDRAKGQGLISEYLVSWRGRGDRLEPKVTVWREAGAMSTKLRDNLARSLAGLVPSGCILVLDDPLRQD